MQGYVYVARIIDHGGNFVKGYHKIGLSKQYKIREQQLNSTHLPFDVLLVRVFETDDMNKIEGILHICFDDYRVIKEYDDRKNITTEWFNIDDIDRFNDKLDKLSIYLNINEIDLGLSIDNDETLTDFQKIEVKNTIGRAKYTNIKVILDDITIFNDTAKETYVSVINKITKNVEINELVNSFPSLFKYKKEDFPVSLPDINKVLLDNGLYMNTWGSNVVKISKLKNVAQYFDVNIVCEIL